MELRLPAGATVLKFENQCEIPCLWAMVDTDLPEERRFFQILGTGSYVSENTRFVGTALFEEDNLVLHLFEEL